MIDRRYGDLTLSLFDSLSKRSEVQHFVTTRQGGTSSGPFASLNLGFGVGDAEGHVLENRRRLCNALGVSIERLSFGQQPGSGVLAIITNRERGRGAVSPGSALRDVDGLITNQAGVALAVTSADCCPVLLYDPLMRVIAAAPVGRLGIVHRVAENVVSSMIERFGCIVEDILVGLGPAISGSNYPISLEQAAAVASAVGHRSKSMVAADGIVHLDIVVALQEQLLGVGINMANIEVSGRDTFNDRLRYFSEQRDRMPTGRHCTGIMLT